MTFDETMNRSAREAQLKNIAAKLSDKSLDFVILQASNRAKIEESNRLASIAEKEYQKDRAEFEAWRAKQP